MCNSTLESAEVAPGDCRSGRTGVLLSVFAFISLIAADLSMRVFGFKRLHHGLRRWRVSSSRSADGRAAAIVRTVDAAARWYFKRAWCVQRSLVTVFLLRLYGFPAQFVVGTRQNPFYAHAWVELDGAAVNEKPDVVDLYLVLDRV